MCVKLYAERAPPTVEGVLRGGDRREVTGLAVHPPTGAKAARPVSAPGRDSAEIFQVLLAGRTRRILDLEDFTVTSPRKDVLDWSPDRKRQISAGKQAEREAFHSSEPILTPVFRPKAAGSTFLEETFLCEARKGSDVGVARFHFSD